MFNNQWPDVSDDTRLTPHQKNVLAEVTKSPVGILTGAPGTGKTFCVAAIVRRIIDQHGSSSVRIAAPTGKAAVRATQAMGVNGIEITATTIHRLLEIGRNGHDGDGWNFLRGPKNPIAAKFLIIDEFSMVDASLAADLFDAMANGTHVMIVGDVYQLPPVGHGAPLRDLIDADVPHGELTEVRRNAGQIVHACVRIKNGESFDTADVIDLDALPPKNLKLISADNETHAADQLVELLKRMKRFDPVWQTQVIVARNAKGELSRKKLNERLHPMLNPEGYAIDGNPFKVGDKIICTRNSRMQRVEPLGTFAEAYAAEMEQEAGNYNVVFERDEFGERTNDPEEVYIANGEIGRVVAVAKGVVVARFSEGDALVKILVGKKREEDDETEGGEGEGWSGCNVELAYAVTCHRLQGSEAPCVIVMGDDGAASLTTREWIYTAISRASKLCVLVGQMATFNKMKSRVSLGRRKTFVKELVQEVLNTGAAKP